MNKRQTTINRIFKLSGIGLHTGREVTLEFIPRREFGIAFVYQGQLIPARYDMVADTRLSTQIAADGKSVSTIEHLMAAFYYSGITNCLVYIDGPEVPIMDGSAWEFYHEIWRAGVYEFPETGVYLKVLRPVEVSHNDAWVRVKPLNTLDITMTIEFRPPVGKQRKRLMDVENAVSIINSRTFVLHEEIEAIRKAGLAKGGSLDNAVVIGGEEILNPNGLRYKKELVNHKILDLIGDLFTCGYRMLGKVEANKTGHYLNNRLLREIFADPDNYAIY
ncbi:UDP-3-O-acyl-N-acetylglucosamine deacetylase [Geobacter sulfurreducens]|jgi:UDP-3-O-[3-hydroxymyristoyl] N-acetylglucosamine deacetylase|uniref:UDP-3-O-acyl-N-acetylglucosamine deacetylase n=1 Tax=Geobacter sulfurreducens (strain ATCC 51573 / DSM 12127 / PCA) TaxID=243231 RepID=Q74F78_GEOSL|nr:UDP-3-O-acyl-N-acetylglucosamine deacetylase [Geobacter sulfurreducens]AAR34061.1 UDP-3-O-(3-hydroxyacyl)-N-acetylglucosamine/UDP-3-N-(3-hydroxyacyl)-2-N-acetylglucosediamine deacetylase [Geobacter sulfurreducens PCA]ADI83573.1 UDP-3-O-(3-hydroxyacyl)-N-acetylglucosamine/UDP-3-N-(3-hydroxyacyl)-2-N-acetylglucosediamine deacetylase [Geobacter sulfurreducens KN400]AJY70477.1 UDP-3-O-(3-hydroxymyristoyl) glucosamine N-acyltransferase [Geobacter sulfurreducens]QVW35986.1 UDP-3-O-acyl-N-acetylglu